MSISGVSVGALGAIKTALGALLTPVGLTATVAVGGVVAAFKWIEFLASKKIEESKEKARKAREDFKQEPCPVWPMIPASASMRWAAGPACSRHAMQIGRAHV